MFKFDHDSYFELYAQAKEVPLTADRVNAYINFICSYVAEQKAVMEHVESQGKDTEVYMYKIGKALHALGLGEKPNPYWRKDN